MSPDDPDDDRIEALTELLAEQRDRIDELEARLDETGTNTASVGQTGTDTTSVGRRSLLYGAGLAGLLGLGAGTATADPQGQVGTAEDPLRAAYTQALGGGLTGDQSVTDLTGTGLAVEGGALSAAGAAADHVDVTADGATVLADPATLEAGTGLTATTDGDAATLARETPANVHLVAESGGDFASVQAALDAAGEGDLVHVAAGTYEESLTWPDHAVHLAGQGEKVTHIVADSGSPAFEVSSGSEIRDLTLESSASSAGRKTVLYHGGDGEVLLRSATVEYTGDKSAIVVDDDPATMTIVDATVRATRNIADTVGISGATVRHSVVNAGYRTAIAGDATAVNSQVVGRLTGEGFGNYDENYDAK